MTEGRRPLAPLVVLVVTIGLAVLSFAASWRDQGIAPVTCLGYAIVGALIARRTENRIGPLLEGVALLLVLTFLSEADVYRWSLRAPPFAGPGWAALVNQIAFAPIAGLIVWILLIYPTGRLPSRRWMWVAWLLAGCVASAVTGLVLRSGSMNTNNPTSLTNPLGARALGVLPETLVWIGFWGVLACAVASMVAVIARSRRARGDEREQIRWLAYVGILGTVLFIGSAVVVTADPGVRSTNYHAPVPVIIASGVLWGGFVLCMTLGIPAAMAFAILRYRLYDIDVVIQKTVVYTALAAFITAVYVGLVVGLGSLLDSRGKPNLALSIVATAVVAIAFQPVRERVQGFANRMVYGKRATPYEALAELSDRLGASYATQDLLPRMARILAEATGASRADVWLRVGPELRVDACWPVDAAPLGSVRLVDDEPPPIAGTDRVAPVRHNGELLGALSFTKQRGEAVSPVEHRLISDLAAQTGLVLRNAGLTEQLLARLEELRASRQRLVTARDEERRRLERDIHDGAQQQLVSLAVRLRLAAMALDRDEAEARAMLAQVRSEASDALETLRELARGIYPPLLADRGLAAALEAQAGKSVIPVEVDSSGIGRYETDVEAAVYFCTLEALQNIAKYAGASRAEVRLFEHGSDLEFEVVDDGRGFDPATTPPGSGLSNMRDRLDAAGGSLDVRSTPGRGTMVIGRLPARGLERVG